jgi:hypothetical protein
LLKLLPKVQSNKEQSRELRKNRDQVLSLFILQSSGFTSKYVAYVAAVCAGVEMLVALLEVCLGY